MLFIEIDELDWIKKFKPIKNHIDTNASFNGEMFETYGEEVEFVKEQDEKYIWTYADGDNGGLYIFNGWHFVNRIGYFITEEPWQENEEYQICIFEPEDELDTV